MPLPSFWQFRRELRAVDAVDPDRRGVLPGLETGDMGEVDASVGAEHDELAVAADGENGAGHCGRSLCVEAAGGARKGLALDLHGLAALDVDDEFLVDRLIANLRVGLDVAEAGAVGGIVGRVADDRKRQ
jgi:hypothetical protein